MNISEYLSKKPKSFLIAIGVLLVISIGNTDYSTGYEISFSIFYMLPITLIAWFVGRLPAVFISVLSAITWLIADLYSGHSYSNYAIPFWNTIMRLGIFLIVTYFLIFIKKLHDELGIRVRERTAELAKSNEALLKVNRAYKALCECNQMLVRITDESGLLCEICRIIVEDGGYRMALVGYAEQDEQKTVRVMAQMGYEENFLKTVNLTWADTEQGYGPLGTAIRTRTPSIFHDIANESKIASWREAALKRGYASAIGLPLIGNSYLLGALAIYSSEPYAFAKEEIKLLTELADDLAYGIMTLRARAERKQAEEALRESEAKYRNLAESLDELIYRADPETFVATYVNRAVERIYGYTVEEWLRDPALWESTIYPEDKERVLAEFTEAQRKMESRVVEYRIIRKDKTVRWVEDHVSWEKDQQGNVVSLNGMVYDITERKQAEDALKESEEKFRKLASSAKDAIIMMDNEGKFFYWNEALERIFGYSSIEILGKEVHTIIAPERYHKDYKKDFALFRETGKGPVIGKTLELVAVKKDGTEFPIELSVSALQFKGKWMSIGILRDITERKQAEEILRASEEKYKTLFKSAGEGILIADIETKEFKYANPAIRKMLGYSEEELLRFGISDIHPKDALERVISEFEAQARGEKTLAIDIPCLRKDGTIIYADINTTKVLLDGRECNLGFFTDITERKKAEEALKRAYDELEIRVRERTKELEDANLELQVLNKELSLRRQEAEDAKLQAMAATRAKSDFLANMSHELRTPLNAIIGFSDMMFRGMTGKLTEQQIEYLGDIRESGELLLSLINDILDLSKVEAGKIELDLSEFNLKELIERSLVMFKEKALKHNIKVKYEVDERIGSITADERRLKQVMFNLLSNAFKFTSDGGSVRVTARRVRSSELGAMSAELQGSYSELRTDDSELDFDMIEITVEDTGIGIRHEDFDKIFLPFQQLGYALTKEYEGTGLGLTLCKRIVELHHGRIWVESEVGKGSKFIFVIPVRQLRSQSSQQEGFR